MKILNLKQGSKEWKTVRNQFKLVTASNAPSFLTPNGKFEEYRKYAKTFHELSRMAAGREEYFSPETKKRFEHGHKAEAFARKKLEEKIGYQLQDWVVTDKKGKLLVSFDAYDSLKNEPYEIKSPSSPHIFTAVAGPKIMDLEESAYKCYIPQVQLQMFVSNASVGHLFIYDFNDGEEKKARYRLFHIKRNQEMIDEMLNNIEIYLSGKYEMTESDTVILDQEPDWIKLSAEWRSQKKIISELEEQLKYQKKLLQEIEGNLEAVAQETLAVGNEPFAVEGLGLKLQRIEAMGSVKWQEAFLRETGLSKEEAAKTLRDEGLVSKPRQKFKTVVKEIAPLEHALAQIKKGN